MSEDRAEGLSEQNQADIRWLERLRENGHCGEGTLESRMRHEHNERIDRLLMRLALAQHDQATPASIGVGKEGLGADLSKLQPAESGTGPLPCANREGQHDARAVLEHIASGWTVIESDGRFITIQADDGPGEITFDTASPNEGELLRRVHDWFLRSAPEHYAGCGLCIDVAAALSSDAQSVRPDGGEA